MTTTDGFLGKLAPHDRAALEERWTVRGYKPKEMIISHDEESRDVFFVLEGRARATIYSEAGRAVAYRDIESGHIFGELAAIDGRPRSASVAAVTSISVARLSQTAFRDVVDKRPGFTWTLLGHLSFQIRRLTDRVYEFSTLVVRKRLVRELLRMADDRDGTGDQPSIRPAPTHFDLAARISTHREAVSREMSALAKKNLIEKRDGALVLCNIALLEKISGGEE
jgi:CRP/FNR family cyclic AMP-dependent transcriptional regulator